MHLYLSSDKPWNTTYTNPSGQVIYKAHSPPRPALGPKRISIKRVLPSIPTLTSGQDDREAMTDAYGHLAEIDFWRVGRSSIRMGGREMGIEEMFRKEGWGFYGRNRVFVGLDGTEYAWHLGSRVCKLYTTDKRKTLIACFHRRRLGMMRKARSASLEIIGCGESMVDLVIVTFVYMERLRREKEEESDVGII
ncbi:hypothetical protein B0H34DRAFT_692217 [Crassisporium funariophilum]|nr:hypothetical protein B0H34DRAFT_692217 [Crassisporium funariophilum]